MYSNSHQGSKSFSTFTKITYETEKKTYARNYTWELEDQNIKLSKRATLDTIFFTDLSAQSDN